MKIKNIFIYKYGEWDELDNVDIPITSLPNIFLATIENNAGNYFLFSSNDITVRNKNETILNFVNTNINKLKKLEKPIELGFSSYNDIKVTGIGNDVLVEDDIPFIITSVGLHEVNNGIVSGIKRRIANNGDFSIGSFNIDLPFRKIKLTKFDILNDRFALLKKFKPNNTFLVFGDSFFKLTDLFKDVGDLIIPRNSFNDFIVDLYIDNIDLIPPPTLNIGLDSFLKSDLVSHETLVKIFTNDKVYLIEYNCDFPLGKYTLNVPNENLTYSSDDLIMYNNKPSTNKIFAFTNEFRLPKKIGLINLRHYRDHNTITLGYKDSVYKMLAGNIFGIDYPIYKVLGG